MSYTLRGRLESRLAAALVPFLAACVAAAVLRDWWPVLLAGAMIGTALTLDVLVYQRLLPYQPGWAALPLGVLELGATMALVRLFEIGAPLRAALWFFAGSWLLAQVLSHAAFPLVRLTYAEDGGELGPSGPGLLILAPAALLVAVGTAAATEPPTVVLQRGVYEGPLVLDHSQTVVGAPGVVVRGGIVITADDVIVRDLEIRGGQYGVTVEGAKNVVLEDIGIAETTMDGVNARRSSLTIRDCTIQMTGDYTQGIDISFAFDLPPSRVHDCTVVGGQEGIVSHMAHVDFQHNRVLATTMRGIAVTEMSMGEVRANVIVDAVGVGIYCGDYSHCEVTGNSVRGTRPDATSDAVRHGHAILAHFGARAEVSDNVLEHNASNMHTYADGQIRTG